MELVEFIFKDRWTFVGTCFLILVIGYSIENCIAAWRRKDE